MSKKFYRDVKLIRACKICGVQFRPKRYTTAAKLRLCHKHREEWWKERYQKEMAYEQTPERKKMRFAAWKKWVEKNEIRRRKLALDSYHRRKHLHAARKHRKVVK